MTSPSIARVYDYWLGGKDNFAADRDLGDKLLALYPPTADLVRENKQFLTRAVAWVAEQGISQFIDIGAGLPTSPSTQETAQSVVPGARVAYVDNDPVVILHLKVLLEKGNQGITVVDRDVRDADAVIAEVSSGIDLTAPSCLIMGSLLHFFPVGEGREMLNRYVAALAPGSHVILSVGHNTDTEQSERFISTYRDSGPPLYYYSAEDITALLAALEVVPPGFTAARAWRAGRAEAPTLPPRTGDMLVGVARVR